MKMESTHAWGLKVKKTGRLYLPFVFQSRTAAKIRAKELPGCVTVRVKIEEAPPRCRTGCAMVDDVPLFCKRHL